MSAFAVHQPQNADQASIIARRFSSAAWRARETQQARIAEWAARVRELSLRQRQVMGLVAQGLSNKDIELSRRREIAQLS